MKAGFHKYITIKSLFFLLVPCMLLYCGCSSNEEPRSTTDYISAEKGVTTMPEHASNWCYVTDPPEFYMQSNYLVLIDPLVLDGLADKLSSLPSPDRTNPVDSIAKLSVPHYTMRIAVYGINDFRPGYYSLSRNDFVSVSHEGADIEVVDVDSGTIIAVDFFHLASVAKALTWEQYDLALQSPIGDDSTFLSINQKVGGPYYAVIDGDINSSFAGDGSYKLKKGAPHWLRE